MRVGAPAVAVLLMGGVVAAGCKESDCEILLTCPTAGAGGASGGAGGSGGAADGGGGTGGSGGMGGAGGAELPSGFARLDCGLESTCAVMTDGSVRCWGYGEYGNIGNGLSGAGYMVLEPATVLNVTDAVEVAVNRRVCARLGHGGLKCWGYGPIGDGTTTSLVPTAVPVDLGQPVLSVSVGRLPFTSPIVNSCAILDDGTGRCWGNNSVGQLGVNPASVTSSADPVIVVNLSDATAVSAGGGHACALTSAGALCWGAGGVIGQDTQSHIPVLVPSLTAPAQISASTTHSCARGADTRAYCWGNGDNGQLGNDDTSDSATPVVVSGLGGVVMTATGLLHSCALLDTGEVWCWGENSSGELGNDSTDPSPVPVKVVDLDDVRMISAGGAFSCAVKNDSTAYCWGTNTSGQLGSGSGNTDPSHVPVPVVLTP